MLPLYSLHKPKQSQNLITNFISALSIPKTSPLVLVFIKKTLNLLCFSDPSNE